MKVVWCIDSGVDEVEGAWFGGDRGHGINRVYIYPTRTAIV